jgi:hypothetical protein
MITPGRFILSRPGYNAGPNLPNSAKILDSDWSFSGSVIAAGSVPWPVGFPYTIWFPRALHFVPAANAWIEGGARPYVLPLAGNIYNDCLVLSSVFKTSTPDPPSAGTLYYQIFGI